MAGTPILTQIETNMQTLIEGMTVAGGYNYNWGTVNQRDYAKCKFPSAVIDLEPEELNMDEAGGMQADAYLNETFFRITVVGKTSKAKSNPVFEQRKVMNKALDDLKQLFGINYNLTGVCDTIMYRRSVRVEKPNGDILIPAEMETFWRVQYTQSRTDPTVPDP